MHTDLPIIRACYQLALELARRVEKFPRHQRASLGADLTALGRGILEHLIRARYAIPRDKPELLKTANVDLEVLRFQLRLAADLTALPHPGHEHLLRLAQDLGRQVGGWLRALANPGTQT